MRFVGMFHGDLRRIALVAAVAVGHFSGLVASSSHAKAAKYAAIVIDANSGRVLHASQADAPRFPASLTKMMTLYIVFDMVRSGRLSTDSKLIITASAASQPPTKLGIKPGGSVKLVNGIRALVTKSANDVAVAIAENLAGSEEKFARYMTWKARQIGMTQTTFRNASGLPDMRQKTTARDMSILALRLIDDFPEYYKFFKIKRFKYRRRSYRNHNALLFNYRGTDGIKTGYTRASGFNLVASVRRGRKHLIGVVMGGRSAGRRNRRMRALLGKAFKRASTKRTRQRTVARPSLVASAPHETYSGLTRTARPRVRAIAPVPTIVRSGYNKGIASGIGVHSERDYHVQVGAHATRRAARAVLASIGRRAGGLLDGYPPLILAFDIAGQQWYRARFAGFSRNKASRVCADLKRRKIDCLAMPAE